jgi:uncharacterized membrane protein YidH (DUF202 family)
MLTYLKKIGEGLPVISLLILLAGYYNIYFYYGLFGITITPFLQTSEIIFSFSSMFESLLVTSVYLFLVTLNYQGRFSLFGGKETVGFRFFEKLSESQFFGLFLIVFPFTIGLGILAWYGLFQKLFFEALVILCMILHIYFFKVAIDNTKYEDESTKNLFRIGSIIFTVTIVLTIINVHRYMQLVKGYRRTDVEVKYNSKLISSTPKFVFIGITNDYLFFLETDTGKKVIFARKDCEWISIR